MSHLSDLLELLIVLEEEPEVLEADVNITIASLLLVLLDGGSPSAEGVLVDLVLDLLGRVRQVDGGVGVGEGGREGGAEMDPFFPEKDGGKLLLF